MGRTLQLRCIAHEFVCASELERVLRLNQRRMAHYPVSEQRRDP